ncbi:hypothetical protein NHX12_003903 [Muraenolepis orangiensis]|uniref:Metallophosphoesterase 1 n=1 Tax=Muraenolepis orangiensis TaxID=630683 RepID=A0A9Q0IF27_9TELE|nr:hypothetical protein NHX12_003903 [Muraenolepis orangiensis]
MPRLLRVSGLAAAALLGVVGVFLFCEYLLYYPVIRRCAWPPLVGGGGGRGGGGGGRGGALRAMVLSDTHLLGAVGGHWFDKLRREWQMERGFQTALWLLRPEIVFILGDIFDEGKWSSPTNWEEDVRRFHRMFRHSSDTQLVVLVGNHDIGFHYEMDWSKLQRFEKVFNSSSTRILTKKGINFLLVNSVALHGDGCPICRSVEQELVKLSRDLSCSLQKSPPTSSGPDGPTEGCEGAEKHPPTPPILLQHYPLYRVSDASCTGEDAAPPEERHLLFREKYDVLSKESSQKLLQWFKPRLILSGHTHSGCEVLHDNRYPEVSVPSFSWRNRNNPSFILATLSEESHSLSKCFLPEESTVIAVYTSAGAVLLLLAVMAHCLSSKVPLPPCLGLGLCALIGKHKYL